MKNYKSFISHRKINNPFISYYLSMKNLRTLFVSLCWILLLGAFFVSAQEMWYNQEPPIGIDMSDEDTVNFDENEDAGYKPVWMETRWVPSAGVKWVPGAGVQWVPMAWRESDSSRTIIAAIMWFLWLIVIVFCIAMIIGLWKLFKKAWRKGWECIIPFYNVFVLWNIAWLEKYVRAPIVVLIGWFVSWLDVIPYFDSIYEIFSAIVFAIMNFFVAKKFWWWTIGSILCIFFSWICYMIIWFWNSEYQTEASGWIN